MPLDGSFSLTELGWKNYPTVGDVPKPEGPFRPLDNAEYAAAEKAKNTANRKIHDQNPDLAGQHIHEIHPVKFGGSPTDPVNKIPLAPSVHYI